MFCCINSRLITKVPFRSFQIAIDINCCHVKKKLFLLYISSVTRLLLLQPPPACGILVERAFLFWFIKPWNELPTSLKDCRPTNSLPFSDLTFKENFIDNKFKFWLFLVVGCQQHPYFMSWRSKMGFFLTFISCWTKTANFYIIAKMLSINNQEEFNIDAFYSFFS